MDILTWPKGGSESGFHSLLCLADEIIYVNNYCEFYHKNYILSVSATIKYEFFNAFSFFPTAHK